MNGWLLGLSAASLISLTNLFSHLHFEAGSNPVTFLLFRYLFVVLALIGIMVITGQSLRIEQRFRKHVFIAGVFSALGAVCLAYAIDMIAVSLAILILYLFPLLTLMMSSALQRRWPSMAMTMGLLIAFGGLVLAIGPNGNQADPLGLAFAFGAALTIAISFVWAEQTLGDCRDGTRLFGLTLTGLVVAIALAGLTRDVIWPLPAPHGWTTLLAATATFGAAYAAMFTAIARIGAPATAMLMNLEPPLTALMAVTLLGDHLSLLQLFGILLVIGAVAAAQWHARRALDATRPDAKNR